MTTATYRKFRCALVVTIMLFLWITNGFSQDLKNRSNRADYVVIAPSSYMPLAEQLASFRHLKNGYTTMAVSIDTVVAQFNVSPAPDSALRNFIQFALGSWQNPKPEYFVLAGNINTIPSHIEAEHPDFVASGYRNSLSIDHWYVEDSSQHLGYGRAQAVLGRLPAWDSAGLAVMIEKQIDYESLPVDAWWGRCIGLADYDTISFDLFESDLQSLQRILSVVWQDTVTVHMNSSSPQYQDSIGFREIWSHGASIVTYCGHANPFALSARRFFTTKTVDSLTNGNRLPICFFGGCDLRFDTCQPSSIPVHLLEQPNAGAVACVASAGITYEDAVTSAIALSFKDLINNPASTVGRAFTNAKNTASDEILRRFTFLGDPAIRIKRPAAVTTISSPKELPSGFALGQNYPNPFNPKTVIRYQVPAPSGVEGSAVSTVKLVVYDLLGREVAVLVNERKAPGSYNVTFDGSRLASGVYYYRLQAEDFVQTRKLLLVK